MAKHEWIPSSLGHGGAMCKHCHITATEASAIGQAECDKAPPEEKIVSFTYRNHRGMTEDRTIDFISLNYQPLPGLGYQAGWFITGMCQSRKAVRSFALTHIILNDPRHVFILMSK